MDIIDQTLATLKARITVPAGTTDEMVTFAHASEALLALRTYLETECPKAHTQDAEFYTHERRILDANDSCRQCKRLTDEGCRYHTICQRAAADYFVPKTQG